MLISSDFKIKTNRKDVPKFQLRWTGAGKNKNISGHCKSGELFAFLSLSTGKSDLLVELAALSPNCSSDAVVYLNGEPLLTQSKHSSYVLVKDCHCLYTNLTVLETLIFSTQLRQPKSCHPAELTALRLLKDMGLQDIDNTPVGLLPIWQQRIILLATEVVAGYDILFFDTPTRDLDAASAVAMIRALQCIARLGKLVAISIGSLTFREYVRLDHIQLLSANGSMYFGPSPAAPAYFAALGRVPTPGASISDFLLDLVDTSALSRGRDDNFLEKAYEADARLKGLTNMNKNGVAIGIFAKEEFASSPIKKMKIVGDVGPNVTRYSYSGFQMDAGIANDMENVGYDGMEEGMSSASGGDGKTVSVPRYMFVDTFAVEQRSKTSFERTMSQYYYRFRETLENMYDEGDVSSLQPLVATQLQFCMWRAFTVRIRNLKDVSSFWRYCGLSIAVGLSFSFYGLSNDMYGFFNRCFLLVTLPFLLLLSSSLWNVDDITDRQIFSYERSKGYYSPIFFPISSLLADLVVLRIAPPVMAGTLLYYFVGLQPDLEKFAIFIQCLIAMSVTGSCFHRVLLNIMPVNRSHFSLVKVSMVSSVLFTMLLLLSGPYLRYKELHVEVVVEHPSSSDVRLLVSKDLMYSKTPLSPWPAVVQIPTSSAELPESSDILAPTADMEQDGVPAAGRTLFVLPDMLDIRDYVFSNPDQFSLFYWVNIIYCFSLYVSVIVFLLLVQGCHLLYWNEMGDMKFLTDQSEEGSVAHNSGKLIVKGDVLLQQLDIKDIPASKVFSVLYGQSLVLFTVSVLLAALFHRNPRESIILKGEVPE